VTALDTPTTAAGDAGTEEADAATASARLDRIEARLELLLDHAERRDAELEPLRDLAAEVGVLAGPAMDTVTHRFAELQDRGYVSFARSSGRVVERIMTSFDDDDVEALGDNVVLMLETLRDLTQPEILQLLRQTAGGLGHLDEPVHGAPPSTLSLVKQLRDPQVRRGLDRLLGMVRSVGTDRP